MTSTQRSFLFQWGGLAIRAMLACTGTSLAASVSFAQDDAFKKIVEPFLKTHCVSCHGPDKQESRLRFDQVKGVEVGNRNLWTMVHERVAAGEMPPPDKKQPAAEEKKQVLSWIVAEQRAVGAGGSRRLNRRELTAALKDVTGLNIDFSFSLPGDGTVAGFDTGAEGLQEASDAVAQWLLVTRRAVDGLRFLDEPKQKTFAIDFREVKDPRKTLDATWKDAGAFYGVPSNQLVRPGLGILFEPQVVGERSSYYFQVPSPADRQGVLRVTMEVAVMKPMPGIPNPRLWVEIGGKDIDFAEVSASPEKPHKLVYEVQMGDIIVSGKGVKVNLGSKVEVPYAIKGYENEERDNQRDPPPGGSGTLRPAFDRKATPPEKQPVPHVIVQSVLIESDLRIPWPPASWKADVGKIVDNTDSAKRLIGVFAERAWRRPVAEADKVPFVHLYEKVRKQGGSFDDGVRAAFQSILLSAPFRYQTTPASPNATEGQYAIASRLSFMLICEPPDDELKKLAAAGKLRDPKVLDQQVDRLLSDPRSIAFTRPFVMQWLEMEQPITIAQTHPNKQDFRFARYLKASMRDETIHYIKQLIDENRPAAEIIHSDWAMLNDALARHYGYDGVEGGHHRKVALRKDDPRGGGILGHAGIQSMLCWMGENWVIYRGAWACRHILDVPPPPPPLEVPELIPSDAKNKGKTFRQLLVQHQEDKRCTVCHKYMDPVGFGFQNFDISGRWRNVEYESYTHGNLDGRVWWYGKGETRPVDSSGHLPRGEKFETFSEFKGLIVKNYQADLVRGIMKKLVLYSTGRTPGIDDMAEIASIMQENRGQGYPLRNMIKGIVRSRAFLEQYETVDAAKKN